jgi:hypothetical protein
VGVGPQVIAAILKTAVGESPPGVRIPPHPLRHHVPSPAGRGQAEDCWVADKANVAKGESSEPLRTTEAVVKKMPQPVRIMRLLMRSRSMVNHTKVQGVLALTAIPIGFLWCWFAITYPDNLWVMCLIGVLSAILFYMAYCVVIYQVVRGRWRWFANKTARPPLPPD